MRLRWKNQWEFRSIGMVLCALLLLSVYCVFLNPAGSAANFVFNGSAIIRSNSPKAFGPERGGHAQPILIGNVRQQQPMVPARFVLFDFKQNLRQWPVLAGDISRSPPLPRTL